MIVDVKRYIKFADQRYYRKTSENFFKDSSIEDFQKFSPISRYTKRKDEYSVKTKYRDFGKTYVRIIKNKKTGNSQMVVVKEKW